MKKTKRKFLYSAMVLATLAPSMLGVTALAETESSKENNIGSISKDPEATLKSVITVNGNPLAKDQAILPGDSITWDIIARPGNTGLLKSFEDTLPKGVKFDPNSKYAVTVYNVNNDGTIGDEITDEGTGSINGKTFTWIPKDPLKYFYVGEESKQNRILFHITTKAEGSVDPDTILENLATITTVNPKNDKEQVVTDTARVHTVKEIKPTLVKHVSVDDGKTWLDKGELKNKDDLYTYRVLATIPVHSVESHFSITDPMENVQSFKEVTIYEGVYSSDAKEITEEPNDEKTESDTTDEKVENSESQSADSTETTISSETSSSTEETSESKETNVETASKTIKNVTNEFDITTENGKIVATAKDSYVKKLGKSKKATNISLVVSGVQLTETSFKELEKYNQGGVTYIPNVASMELDKDKVESNKTVVSPPTADSKQGAIGKSVSTDEGKSWVNNGELQSQDKLYDYKIDVTAPFQQDIKELAINDTFIAGQDLDQAEIFVKIVGSEESSEDQDTKNDVTSQGKLEKNKDENGNTLVSWKANDELIKKINDANEQTGAIKFTMLIKGVSIKNASKEQLDALLKGDKIVVPNDAQLVVTGADGNEHVLKSNEVTVSLPTPALNDPLDKEDQPQKDFLANTAEALKQNIVLAIVGALLILGGSIFGLKKWKQKKQSKAE